METSAMTNRWRNNDPASTHVPANSSQAETSPEDDAVNPVHAAASSPTADETTSPGSSNARGKTRVWALPWVIMLIAMYAFTLPWIGYAIIQLYFTKPNFEAVLPGLGTTYWRKLTMRGHMASGAVCLLLGPFQFIPILRKKLSCFHRWSGRIYCSCAMASCLFGLAFIALKGKLVGGWNMTAAFSFAGATIGILGFKVWQSARAAKAGEKVEFTSHRNWGIRSYSQILAPMLYRYWYICVELFGMYQAPKPQSRGGYCTSDGLCPAYLRLFDMIHCWTYWLTALVVAEVIIYFLPKHMAEQTEPRDETERPLLASPFTDADTDNQADARMPSRTPSSNMDADHAEDPCRPIQSPCPLVINTIGWFLACTAVAITVRLFTSPGM